MMLTKKGDTHQHTYRKGYKKTRNTNGIRYLLMEVCTGCDFKEAYDLVSVVPVTNREDK